MKHIFLTLIAIFALTACSSDDDNQEQEQQQISQSHTIEFTTGTLEGWVSVILTTTVTLDDGTESTINSDFNYTQNIVSVEIPENTASFELDFYIEDSSQAEMRFYGSVDNVNVHQESINQQSFQYEYIFN
ncbi:MULTISPECIES: membrane lipoprotein lipid attachment site-containing protein [Bizionia]|uniref:Uncharacterized protein n=1 Tax=Bizionia algoritergicola TaxID=291187 RepID=A0A5D0R0T6_9FLAO|nr:MULTISPECIES: membrane lipoprotein lipid attachment site-containing protein [Bizionia]OBX24232.1 hypothetical protein BAA08_00065 [Bizionia sp. APA-3]TYB75153.1 hypothetical protein ES675_03220 [Bizionia algoritergicola]